MKYLDHEVGIDSECVFEVLEKCVRDFFRLGARNLLACWLRSYDAVVKE